MLTGARTAPCWSRDTPGMWQDQAWRCHLMPPSNINHGLCCARQSTRQTQPCCLSSCRGARGAPTATAGRYLGLDHPCLPPSSAAAYSRTVTARFCISSFSTASRSPRSPLLKRARPPYQPHLWLSPRPPQRGRRAGSRCRPTHLLH